VNNWALYTLTVLIWGSTWIGIKFQLGVVDPMASVAHRFALSALLTWLLLLLRGELRRLQPSDHAFLLLQGLCLFCINYYFVYHAELALTSGLVAVVFSSLMLMNILNGALFMGQSVRPRVLAGGLVGLSGVVAVFWPELLGLDLDDAAVIALLYGVAGTAMASFGNIIALRNQRQRVPLLLCNAWAMTYGALAMYLAALLSGTRVWVDWQPSYLVSLLYLSVFGSVIAFWAYLTLIGRIGADRAGYANLLYPLVALLISTAVEDYRWSVLSVAGMALIMLGNWLVMRGSRA
jgi:drug/metabolite transporter (DMT)-like permease